MKRLILATALSLLSSLNAVASNDCYLTTSFKGYAVAHDVPAPIKINASTARICLAPGHVSFGFGSNGLYIPEPVIARVSNDTLAVYYTNSSGDGYAIIRIDRIKHTIIMTLNTFDATGLHASIYTGYLY